MDVSSFETIFAKFRKCSMALYGISTYTEEILNRFDDSFHFIGLLDGYKEDGYIYGKRIISLTQAIKEKVEIIVIVARQSSQRIIFNRIYKKCRENSIFLCDLLGNDLNKVDYGDYCEFIGDCIFKDELIRQIKQHELISFDIFDTLIMRKTLYSTDVFDIMENDLYARGRRISKFSKLRQSIECELSQTGVPSLDEIYHALSVKIGISAVEEEMLKNMELETEKKNLVVRTEMYQILQYALNMNKCVWLVSDMYFSKNQLEKILSEFNITGYHGLIVSCEYGTTKEKQLFRVLLENTYSESYLHIGDNYETDIVAANQYGIDAYAIYSGIEMMEKTPLHSIIFECDELSKRVKIGMLKACLFNNPFIFDKHYGGFCIDSPYKLGYLLFAPVITDFVMWLYEVLQKDSIDCVLFGARDGWLIKELFDDLQEKKFLINNYDGCKREKRIRTEYFLTSRISAVNSAIDQIEDILRETETSFQGSFTQMLKTRFLLKDEEIRPESDGCLSWYEEIHSYKKVIIERAKVNRDHYLTYIKKIKLDEVRNIAFFDFVSSGTCQLALEKLMKRKLKGYYFKKIKSKEPRKEALDVTDFYNLESKIGRGGISEDYFILEHILTSPMPSLKCFDMLGNPQYLNETRSRQELKFIEEVHCGIRAYFNEYQSSYSGIRCNKCSDLSEQILKLVHSIPINNSVFLNLRLEDNFYNRSTGMTDLL